MKLNQINTDLFNVNIYEYALAHCISLDCAMGAGIAKIFRNKYPQMVKELKNTIEDNNLNSPCTILYMDDHTPARIFNLITKERYYYKPTYDTLTKALKEMRQLCLDQNINRVAMPLIGCGLDKLKWNEVKKIINKVFADTNIEILVCKL